ncbi:MAG: malonyl-CoA synthase [Rhizobiales bacterium]|nr:malonyl-CoA synthase [Hyphomicrobiales bacterium]
MGNANLYSLLEERFLGAGEAIAFRPVPGEPLSYLGLCAQVARYANALEAEGVAPGDRVTVQIEKSLDNVFLYLATLKVGAVYQPLNTAYTAAEVDYFISDAKPSLVVCDPSRAESLKPIAAQHGVKAVHTMAPSGEGSLQDLAANQSAEHTTAQRAPDDLAGLLYTSGTTGRSKGAMITHDNLSSNALALHRIWHFQPGDVLLHALPIFHVHGLYVALNTAFLNQSEIIWLQKFDANQVLSLLPEATVMMGVPTFYTRLLQAPAFNAEACRNIRLFVSGSAPMLAETHVEFEGRTGQRILERYGMTEAGMITSNPYDGERRAGTVGYALPDVSVRIAAEDGTVLGPGEIGVLEAKGPNIFAGYWQMPEKTAEEFRPDGYFITGDMAQMEPDGRVTIVGRSKDLIISGGFNVYPKEVETELDDMPGVGESAVIGVPHPDFGEGVVAVITAQEGQAPEEADIISALSQRLAKFKVPKRVFQHAELPRNAMGKVQKAELRAQYGEIFKA